MKKIIRLTESDIHKIVKESVEQILLSEDYGTPSNADMERVKAYNGDSYNKYERQPNGRFYMEAMADIYEAFNNFKNEVSNYTEKLNLHVHELDTKPETNKTEYDKICNGFNVLNRKVESVDSVLKYISKMLTMTIGVQPRTAS